MLGHAARAVPWLVIGSAAALVTVLLRTVAEWPYQVWPLQGIAVGLVAGAATWAFDEPAAALVDTLPRDLGWRTVARSVAVAGLLAWWLVSVWWTRTAYFGHAVDVAVQGCALTLATTAAVTCLRSRGVDSPASAVGTLVAASALFLALVRPVEDALPLFPYTSGGDWAASQVLWSSVGVLSVAVLVVTLRAGERLRTVAAPGSP